MSGPWEEYKAQADGPWADYAQMPASVSFGQQLREIPRQVGLTARYGMEGLADVAGIVTEPIRMGLNLGADAVGLPRISQTGRQAVSNVADLVGLPSPETADERVVGDVARLMAPAGAMAKGAQTVSNLVQGPVTKAVTGTLAANPGAQVVTSGGAGAAGGSVREAGGGEVEQFGASLAGGLSTAGLTGLAGKLYGGISGAVKQLLTPKNTPQQINIVLNQILEQNGVNVSQVSGEVRSRLAAEVKRALDTGQEINPDVVRRIADYGVVGATPTRGSVTLDPVQITQERNLAKVGANSSDPRLQELARTQNANNQRFIEYLNEMGGNTPNANPVTAGRAVVDTIKATDDAAKATEKALYAKARDSSGRSLALDREGFVFDAYNRLGESNKSAFLPENIKNLLEGIRSGKMSLGHHGPSIDVPFNVDVIDNLKTMLATASRSASDGNVRAALSQVRAALDDVTPKAVGRQVGGNQVVDPAKLSMAQTKADDASKDAMKAFDEARRFAKGRRDWQESAPAITDALNGIEPDRFVQNYIIANTGKSATAHVEKLLHELQRNPEALQAVKQHVVSYLKNRALSGAADEVGNFSQSAYNRALNDLGDMKLKILFSKDEISQLKALGRVSSYEMVQPKGSAVNNSNTASGFAGILERIANSPLVGKIPFGDAALRAPARSWSTQINVGRATDPAAAVIRPREKTRALTIKELLGPGLLLAAPRADGRNDDKRY